MPRVDTGNRGKTRNWAGGCRAGLAYGLGAALMTTDDGAGAGVFAGWAVGGRAVSGVTKSEVGWYLLQSTGPIPGAEGDAEALSGDHAFRDAFAGARAAAEAYRASGNIASSNYYEASCAELIKGQPE